MSHQPFFRTRPMLVRQKSGLSCWAAALASWLSVACPSAALDEAWAISTFRAWQGADQRLDWPGLKDIAVSLDMAWEDVGRGALSPDYFSSRLPVGHLWMTYVPSPGLVAGHTVVVYGVTECTLDLMDPNEGYTSKPLEFFASRSRAFVGWPPRGGAIPDPRSRITHRIGGSLAP